MKDRVAGILWSVLILLGLNFILFFPYFYTIHANNDFLPFFPSHHPRGAYDFSFQSLREYVLQMLFRRHNLDPFRLSVEMVFIGGFIALGRSFLDRGKRIFLLIATCSYVFFFILECYRMIISLVLDRSTLWLEDMQLIGSGIQFCKDTLRLPNYVFETLCGFGVFVLCIPIYFLFSLVWKHLRISKWEAVFTNVFMLTFIGLFLNWFGTLRNDTTVQLLSKHLVYNYERCLVYLENNRNFPEQTEHHRRFYTQMAVKPNIFLFVIESYGMVLFNDNLLRERMQLLLADIEEELEEIPKIEMLSHLSTAPVYGGASWLSTASLIAGTPISNHARYELFKNVAPSFPHLVNYLGYHSYDRSSFQPGTDTDSSLYGFDQTYVKRDMEYNGEYIGWGGVPDYSTFLKMEKEIDRLSPPFFFHYMSLTTHIPWQLPPRLPRKIFSQEGTDSNYYDAYVEGLEGGKGSFRNYFLTVSYEWRLMSDFLRKKLASNFLVIIVGDHQPLPAKSVDASHDVPIHVLSDVPSLIAGFKNHGFTSGLIPPKKKALKHQIIYPIILESVNFRNAG